MLIHLFVFCAFAQVFLCRLLLLVLLMLFSAILCVQICKNYVNLYEFTDNKWCCNNKNVFTANRAVNVSGGSGLKPQNGQFKVF